ncbi:MAG: alpha/beta hydrolase [Candidatus Micrarchaeota archaeon]|nr:alpha/beta hydrolase [Candidatus Micrarchaeota archaeon]
MEFIRVTTSDNLILQGLFSEPKASTDSVILHIHGMSGNFWENGFIKTMLSEYPKNGVAFLTVETRGSEVIRFFGKTDGNFVKIGNAYEIFEECTKDIQAWIDLLSKNGYKRIYLQGHSLGCSKIAYYQSTKNDRRVKALLFISAADMLGLVLNPRDLPLHTRHIAESENLVGKGKGGELLPDALWATNQVSAKTYLNFFSKTAKTAIFNYYDAKLGFATIKTITIPMLSIFGTKDDGIVTDPYKSNEILKENAIKSPKFVGVVFDGAQHSYAGFEDQIVESVLKFIKEIEVRS